MDGCQLKLKVVPNASRNEVLGWQGDVLRVKVQSPPEDGKANEAVIETLASFFGVHRRSIAIVQGAKARNKTVEIKDITLDAINERLGKSN